jgi:hypothetical protein
MPLHIPDSSFRSRITPLRVALAIALLCAGAGTVAHHVALARLQEQMGEAAPAARLAALENRLAGLEAAVDDLANRPAPGLAHHETRLQALEARREAIDEDSAGRLAALELSIQDRLPLDLAALGERVGALEIRLAEWAGAPFAPLSGENGEDGECGERGENGGDGDGEAPPPFGDASLPFGVIGVEVRGGAHFVVINDPENERRLLYPGDVASGWRLDAIDGGTAIFRRGEITYSVVLP